MCFVKKEGSLVPCAVKSLHDQSGLKDRIEFLREAALMEGIRLNAIFFLDNNVVSKIRKKNSRLTLASICTTLLVAFLLCVLFLATDLFFLVETIFFLFSNCSQNKSLLRSRDDRF